MLRVAAFPSPMETLPQGIKELTAHFEEAIQTALRQHRFSGPVYSCTTHAWQWKALPPSTQAGCSRQHRRWLDALNSRSQYSPQQQERSLGKGDVLLPVSCCNEANPALVSTRISYCNQNKASQPSPEAV